MYNLKKHRQLYSNTAPLMKKLIMVFVTAFLIIAVPLALLVLDTIEYFNEESSNDSEDT